MRKINYKKMEEISNHSDYQKEFIKLASYFEIEPNKKEETFFFVYS